MITSAKELVAQRISRFTDIVGRERVLTGTDCGFGTIAGLGKVNAESCTRTWRRGCKARTSL